MAECLAVLEHEAPSCAVVDINLGKGPTFEIPVKLRERGVPFVFLTGYDADVIPLAFADVERLEKPVVASRLVKAIERLCGNRDRTI